MRKTDKKMDNLICQTLTRVCEQALKDYDGFSWLTHQADYSRMPKSLHVTCVFSQNHQLDEFMASVHHKACIQLIQQHLHSVGIPLSAKAISFDTEQRCDAEHGGNWAKRLARH